MSSFLLPQTSSSCFVRLTWMVLEMGGKWPCIFSCNNLIANVLINSFNKHYLVQIYLISRWDPNRYNRSGFRLRSNGNKKVTPHSSLIQNRGPHPGDRVECNIQNTLFGGGEEWVLPCNLTTQVPGRDCFLLHKERHVPIYLPPPAMSKQLNKLGSFAKARQPIEEKENFELKTSFNPHRNWPSIASCLLQRGWVNTPQRGMQFRHTQTDIYIYIYIIYIYIYIYTIYIYSLISYFITNIFPDIFFYVIYFLHFCFLSSILLFVLSCLVLCRFLSFDLSSRPAFILGNTSQ